MLLPRLAAKLDAIEPVGREQRHQVAQRQIGSDRVGVQAQFHGGFPFLNNR